MSATDADYGARVLAALRARGVSTSQWSYAAITAMEKASREEFAALFKRHDLGVSYALLEAIRTDAPEAFVERLTAERSKGDIAAMVPMMFSNLP